MKPPILFCHYGTTDYLSYVLSCARSNNQDKEIVLIGDDENRSVAEREGIYHIPFRTLNHGDKIEQFERHYELIDGEDHVSFRGGRDWVKFVFKRWFFVERFVEQNGIDRFWHFDSDNMLLDTLSVHEKKFDGVDCTTQCNGKCMNGFVSNSSIVQRYTEKIIELFGREEYLAEQKREFREEHPEFAFTEMRAFETFVEEENVETKRLNTIVDGESFDDCICQQHGYEMESLDDYRKIKVVTLGEGGRFYCWKNGKKVEMISLNLSWVPTKVFEVVHQHSTENNLYLSGQTGLTVAQVATPSAYERAKVLIGKTLDRLTFK